MEKTTFNWSILGVAGLLVGSILLFSLNPIQLAISSHGGPLNWIEGLHDEGVALSGTERPILMGGDDGTNLVNVLVDSGGRVQVDIVDGSASGGQVEDAVAASGDSGAHLLVVRDDTPASATAANADYQSLIADAFGGLYVRILGTSGAAYDPSLANVTLGTTTYSEAGTVGTPIGAVRNDTPVAALADTDNELAPLQVDAFGGLYVRMLGTDGAAFDPTLARSGSPTTLVDTFVLFDGSAETQIANTNLGASKSITITGSGTITKVCIISSLGSVLAQDGAIIFFDADPAITVDTADLTLAEAQNVVAVVDFVAADYLTSFASSAVACVDTDKSFASITHVVYHSLGATLLDDEDLEMRVLYERAS